MGFIVLGAQDRVGCRSVMTELKRGYVSIESALGLMLSEVIIEIFRRRSDFNSWNDTGIYC
jgi:hypothetical protein